MVTIANDYSWMLTKRGARRKNKPRLDTWDLVSHVYTQGIDADAVEVLCSADIPYFKTLVSDLRGAMVLDPLLTSNGRSNKAGLGSHPKLLAEGEAVLSELYCREQRIGHNLTKLHALCISVLYRHLTATRKDWGEMLTYGGLSYVSFERYKDFLTTTFSILPNLVCEQMYLNTVVKEKPGESMELAASTLCIQSSTLLSRGSHTHLVKYLRDTQKLMAKLITSHDVTGSIHSSGITIRSSVEASHGKEVSAVFTGYDLLWHTPDAHTGEIVIAIKGDQ